MDILVMIFVTEYTKAEHDDDDASFDFEWSVPGTRSYTVSHV